MSAESTTWATTMGRNRFVRAGRWLVSLGRCWQSRPARQLHLRETLALGEKRFLAVVEFGHRKFLIGGTANSVALLAQLPDRAEPASGRQPGLCRSAEVGRKGDE
jgi:flagellar biogenesis protein FliO